MEDLYIEMLCYRRPGRSQTEEEFIEKYIVPLGAKPDDFGNYILRIGTEPVMWSCHTDTVHYNEGTQVVRVDGVTASIGPPSLSNSNCLGADCTTGVWIMTEMIKAGKPGLYIFHRDEEHGGQGSNWIVKNTPALVDGIKYAIAFDRYGTTSIITNQMGVCCSDDFANSMIEQMPGFRIDPHGIFTDTAFYTDLIPECTNVSVGYIGHHSQRETQNLSFMRHVLNLMLNLDISKLRASRDPSVVIKYPTITQSRSQPSLYKNDWTGHYDFAAQEDMYEEAYYPSEDKLTKTIKSNPEATASLLRMYGITYDELIEHVFATNKQYVMMN